VCRRLVAFHDQRPAPSPQLTPSPPTCNRNGPRRKVLRRWWRGWKLGNSRNPMFSPLSDLATDTQILEFQGCHVGHAQQQSLRAQPPRVVSSRQGGTPSAVHASSKILVEREVRPEQQREALHRAHTVHMSLDPGLVRPFAISVRPGRIPAIPSDTGIPLRHPTREGARQPDSPLYDVTDRSCDCSRG